MTLLDGVNENTAGGAEQHINIVQQVSILLNPKRAW